MFTVSIDRRRNGLPYVLSVFRGINVRAAEAQPVELPVGKTADLERRLAALARRAAEKRPLFGR